MWSHFRIIKFEIKKKNGNVFDGEENRRVEEALCESFNKWVICSSKFCSYCVLTVLKRDKFTVEDVEKVVEVLKNPIVWDIEKENKDKQSNSVYLLLQAFKQVLPKRMEKKEKNKRVRKTSLIPLCSNILCVEDKENDLLVEGILELLHTLSLDPENDSQLGKEGLLRSLWRITKSGKEDLLTISLNILSNMCFGEAANKLLQIDLNCSSRLMELLFSKKERVFEHSSTLLKHICAFGESFYCFIASNFL